LLLTIGLQFGLSELYRYSTCMFNYIVLLRSALFWDITQCIVVIPYPCFGDNLSVPSSIVKILTHEDGTDRLSQRVLVRNYHYMLRHIPEEHISSTLWEKLEILYCLVASYRLLRRLMQNQCDHQQRSLTVYKKRSKVILAGRLQMASLVS